MFHLFLFLFSLCLFISLIHYFISYFLLLNKIQRPTYRRKSLLGLTVSEGESVISMVESVASSGRQVWYWVQLCAPTQPLHLHLVTSIFSDKKIRAVLSFMSLAQALLHTLFTKLATGCSARSIFSHKRMRKGGNILGNREMQTYVFQSNEFGHDFWRWSLL